LCHGCRCYVATFRVHHEPAGRNGCAVIACFFSPELSGLQKRSLIATYAVRVLVHLQPTS
jgi:hypothetical protein